MSLSGLLQNIAKPWLKAVVYYLRLFPISTTERNTLTVSEGTILYNSTESKLNIFQSGSWVSFDVSPKLLIIDLYPENTSVLPFPNDTLVNVINGLVSHVEKQNGISIVDSLHAGDGKVIRISETGFYRVSVNIVTDISTAGAGDPKLIELYVTRNDATGDIQRQLCYTNKTWPAGEMSFKSLNLNGVIEVDSINQDYRILAFQSLGVSINLGIVSGPDVQRSDMSVVKISEL